MNRLFGDIQYVKGIGPKRSKLLNKLNIYSVFDLLWHIPRSYINRDNLKNIAQINIGEYVNIKGRIVTVSKNRSRNGMHIFKAIIEDKSGIIQAVWFNQPHIEKYLQPGVELYLSGKTKSSYEGLELNVYDYEIIDNSEVKRKILPIYPLTDGLSQKFMRSVILQVLEQYLSFYPEIFTTEIRETYNISEIKNAFHNIHFPVNREAYIIARKRLALEELFLFQLSIRQSTVSSKKYIVHKEKTPLVSETTNNLSFTLTNAQKKVIREIFTDMEKPYTMNRLIQGDVGSGKTVVAALAMAKAVASGYQSALMAPTEILADQHFVSLSKFFNNSEVVIAKLTGSTPTNEKKMILEALIQGNIDILVGTHTLIQDDIAFQKLGLVVIDEQHRFGVKQRAALANKGTFPDILVMTATPIPRTLALTVYGDLDLSVIDEMPPGRKPVKTIYVKRSYRTKVYNFIHNELKKNVQAYVVCPLVEESEKQDLQAAETLYEELRTTIFKNYKVGLLHGRLRPAEKDFIMSRFKQGDIDVLVSTTVIEVGVDVPNASIIVIEQAERFGLSQLHQLRGRVGRGNLESYCFLIADPNTEEALHRLKAMEKTNDGFVLANEDLIIRGPGDFWGVRQHGLDQLKVADLVKDKDLIELSQKLVKKIGNKESFNLYIKKKFNKDEDIAPN